MASIDQHGGETRSQPLTLGNLKRHDAASAKDTADSPWDPFPPSGDGDDGERKWYQFGCDCSRSDSDRASSRSGSAQARHLWWRFLPRTRKIARCPACKTPRCALPEDEVIGYSKLECPNCGKKWTSDRCMYNFGQPCLRCRAGIAMVQRIEPRTTTVPPEDRPRGRQRTTEEHHCNAPGCQTPVEGVLEPICNIRPVSARCDNAPPSTVLTRDGIEGTQVLLVELDDEFREKRPCSSLRTVPEMQREGPRGPAAE